MKAPLQAVCYSIKTVCLEDGFKEVITELPYEPLFVNPLDHVRMLAARAGLTLEEVEKLAKDLC